LRWKQRAEALHEGDGTRVWVGDAVCACASPLPGEQLGEEHTQCLAQEVAVSGEQKPHSTRQLRYSLSTGHDWEYAVDEIGRGVCHSTTRARRAESAGLARERDQALLGTRVTPDADEAVAQEATGEELLELALDELWVAKAVFRTIARGVEQRCEMVLHDAIEHGGLRLAAGIATRCRGDVGGSRWVGARSASWCPPAGHSAIGCPDPGPDRSVSQVFVLDEADRMRR